MVVALDLLHENGLRSPAAKKMERTIIVFTDGAVSPAPCCREPPKAPSVVVPVCGSALCVQTVLLQTFASIVGAKVMFLK